MLQLAKVKGEISGKTHSRSEEQPKLPDYALLQSSDSHPEQQH